MADDPENHTIRLLQEMRAEMRERLDGIDTRLDDLTTRVNGVTIMLGTALGALHEHNERLEKLEAARGEDA